MAPLTDRHIGRRDCLKLTGAALMSATIPSCNSSDTPATAPQNPAHGARGAGRSALVYDPFYKRHLPGSRHPENPQRCDAIMGALKQANILADLVRIKPRHARDDDILACHAESYLRTVRRDVEAGARSLSTGDTDITGDSFQAALLAAGGAICAVDAVVSGKVKNAFCLVRPPGHHATENRGMGFCILNNAAVAARYAQRKCGLKRALIVDWDVHHGNGTQDIFYSDPTVFYFSTHQSPWYPGTGAASERGAGEAVGTTLNCPLARGAGRREVLGAFETQLAPALVRFKPNIVIISAGFDSRINDPLGQFRLTDRDFADLTHFMTTVADDYADGRVVAVLEGGYNLDGLGKAAAAHVAALMKA